MATVAQARAPDWTGLITRHWLLAIAAATVVFPTVFKLGQEAWSSEAGMHGPIVLATGLWLIFRRKAEIEARMRPGELWLALAGLLVAVPAYAFGRAFDFLSIEVAAMLLALFSIAYGFFGGEVMRMMWFPAFYLGFLVPIPGWIIDKITAPLKLLVSEVVTHALTLAGYPIARAGVTIYVAQYQLLVEDACAGLNSLVSLSAIGLFYVYIMRGSNWRYSMLLLAMVVPVAIAANIVRVAILVLLTYHAGDAVAQGFLHKFAGMVTFTSALLFIFLLDSLLKPLREALAPRPEAA